MNNIISCQNIHYHYNDGARTTSILKGLNLEVKNGESIAILGQSGCGKSTLLNVLGGIDKVNTGQLLINNTDISTLNEKKITELRAKHLGFVYQFHHLLKDFNALKNIMMPLLIQGVDSKTAKANAMALLKQMNLTHRATHLPGELSGGERQRVAIGRALINQPQCLLADEPTGNLDAHTASEVLALMIKLNEQQKSALVIVTHDEKIAAKMQRTLVLENGVLS